MSATARITDTCFTDYIRSSSQFMACMIYSMCTSCLNDACKVFDSIYCVCVYVSKAPEPKYTFGPGGKKTLTFSAQTHGFSIFPEVFETFLRFSTWKWGDPTHRQINSCTCLPARAVATSSVSSYSTKNCMQSAKKQVGTSNCRALPRFLAHIWDAGELTVVAVEFGGVDPVAPRLSQHYFWTR